LVSAGYNSEILLADFFLCTRKNRFLRDSDFAKKRDLNTVTNGENADFLKMPIFAKTDFRKMPIFAKRRFSQNAGFRENQFSQKIQFLQKR
jgi:hypothetical protein